ncbi:MAG: 23S rRNA (uracil(1939)-C(5))-methyltransferase RlmD [Tannerella sp.]|jgi:23S rRNA (uracil1939-C5)-methyltransferase|nr:23S rRNA (uracil(1939)-C(5))-methyltransferase RlmD [Tannerella sp.]
MKHKKKPLPVLQEIEITDVAAEGKALAKVNDLVVFVPWVAPGDIVDIQLTRKKNSYAEGRAVKFHKYAAERAEPFCEHFSICGGCKWQHLPYEAQLRYKQQQVTDHLTRIGKVDMEEILPIAGSEQTVFYRNKLEFTFSNKRWLTAGDPDTKTENTPLDGAGFHIPGKFDKVLDIKKCWLQEDISNRIRLFIKNFCITRQYPFFDLRAQTGFIRTLVIRTSSTGEVMVIAVFFEEDETKREQLLNAVKDHFPEITSLMYVINGKCNDTISDLEVHSFHGKDHLIEKMEDLQFKVGPKSFYQTNSRQACLLYSITREFAGLTGKETVYDLYTGTGVIANFIAGKAGKVIGIESVPEAIEDAKINAKLNRLDNTSFFAGDMKDLLTPGFIEAHGKPDVIITDPPRAGMHDDVTDTILASAPERIVYVSCNPATQARDLNRLSLKYRVARVQPVDMFPHTHHVENVVLLVLKHA